MVLNRKLDLNQFLKKKSFFLLGPRSTGKTFWIKNSLPKEIPYINLLTSDTYLRLIERPALLEEMIGNKKLAVIDEIQKIPELLDEVHNLIESKDIHFLLTGSSARKLKSKSVNMLGGRAQQILFFPFSYSELEDFELAKFLTYGGLPRIYLSEDPLNELDAYVTTYLEQEIKAEALVRNLTPFSRFLKLAALTSGELINYSNISSDCGVSSVTVKEYYSILSDTLVGYNLEPWLESKKRKAIQTAKFYFFDTGVVNFISGYLQGTTLQRNSNLWGKAFEQFILMELRTYISYRQKRKKIYFWRSENKQEVDFIVEDIVAIEVKSSRKISSKMFTGLKALKEERILKKYILVSEDPISRTQDGIQCLYWKTFLTQLWNDQIF